VKDEHKHHEVFSHFRRWKGCVPLASMWIFSVVTTACPTSLRPPRNRLRALKHLILLPSTMNTLNGSIFSRQSYPRRIASSCSIVGRVRLSRPYYLCSNAFSSIMRARPRRTADRFIVRATPIDYDPILSPHALRIRSHTGHPALRHCAAPGIPIRVLLSLDSSASLSLIRYTSRTTQTATLW